MVAKKMLVILVCVLAGLLVLVVLFLAARTVSVSRDARAKLFAAGHLPSPLPSGFYPGTVNGYKGAWTGKTFNQDGTGINNFRDSAERYPFKFYPGPGLKNKDLTVLKIDYNLPANPFWLRLVVDELVETTTPGTYLGKLQIRFLGLTFSGGYFALKAP